MAKRLSDIDPEELERAECSVVFFDIDGTLVNASGQIHPRCCSAVRALQGRGVVVALASGRPFFAARPIVAELAVRDACMFFGGAMIVDPQSQQVLQQQVLSPQQVRSVVELLRREEIHCELYSVTDCYIERQTNVGRIHEQYLGQPMKVAPLDSVIKQEQVVKLVAVTSGAEEESRLRTLLLGLDGFATGIAYGAAHPGMLFANITSLEASRARCFDFFLNYFGVSANVVMAFGDGEADIPFLERAGFGVAMGNAQWEVQNAARYVTKSVEEQGVAYALERLCGVV